MSSCNICPRECLVNREKGEKGFCGATDEIYLAKVTPFYYEEPPISGDKTTNGSGMLFFSGCSLRCVYCQNKAISRFLKGKPVSKKELGEIILKLQEKGVLNINLVTPTHYAEDIAAVLKDIKPLLHIPVIYNCGGYEKVETLKKLEGLIDIYLPDLKYFSSEYSLKYSGAENYFPIAIKAIKEMVRQTGKPNLENSLLKRGVMVRHLVLPSLRLDSIDILNRLYEEVGSENILLSLMRQYTPDFAPESFPELKRKVTEFEYNSVLKEAEKLGFSGFSQDKTSASSVFTPNF
ncbi:MAG: radical SAM protein [Oscillospiraceae bacterium]|nr:radical SAM protein [Oscillospiraceae bacterium]